MKPLIDRACVFLATGFGSGIATCALTARLWTGDGRPKNWGGAGFVGTVLGLILIILGLPLQGWAGFFNLAWLTALSVWVSGRCERHWNVKDDPRIIADEIVGMLWSLAFIPLSGLGTGEKAAVLASGFVLFRVFDVFKVPSKKVQEIPGGVGVVIDDVLAGITANLCLRMLIRFLF